MTTQAWAKLDANGGILPLAAHGADVAAVMGVLLHRTVWRRRLEYCASRQITSQDVERLLVLAFLHDLGKANRGFWERQWPGKPVVGHTNQTATLLYHDRVRCQSAPQKLIAVIENWGAPELFFAVMAHHGRPLEVYADQGQTARNQIASGKASAEIWLPGKGYDPLRQLEELLDAARAQYPSAFADGLTLPETSEFVSLFCGLMMLADWLGSDTKAFPVRRNGVWDREVAARRVVEARGLAETETPVCGFGAAFAVGGPQGLQEQAADVGLGAVALLEAETGSGKTEAALWRWLALRRCGAVDGLYFALPTRSAAVQLHRRVQAMLGRAFGGEAPEAVLAVPGYLRAGDADGQALPEFAVLWPDEGDGNGRWAAERPKRFLSARVAVGTIDQALMAGLRLPHAHLRAAALARSLLVVDEVHASDAFMGAVLERVLANHRAFGGHAMLLSATLTGEARTRLLGRGTAPDWDQAERVPYPALSGSAHDPRGGVENRRPGKRVVLETWAAIDDAEAIAARAVKAARLGASVLVVRNSVRDAVAVAQAVEVVAPELAFRVGGVSTLHHGRFAPEDRRALDEAVEAAFGKSRNARGRVLCGTQTLEQSLDLDADLLITDLAPIDVLLQRIGRLHRHRRTDRGVFGEAKAVVLRPEERDLSALLGRVRDRHGLGPMKNGNGVYPDLLVLEATLRLVEGNPTIAIPDDNRRLVEGALHPVVRERLGRELGTAWRNHAAARDGSAIAERGQAKIWSLDLTAPFGTLLFPDEETIATRLGLRDRVVEFETAFAGPFGRPVQRLIIPAWMAGNMPSDATPTMDDRDGEGAMRFRIGERAYRYGRWGLILVRNE